MSEQDAREVDQQEVEEIEREREQRLAAENRPDAAEVDNTQRDFDVETGLFTDSEGHDEAEKVYQVDDEG